MKLSIVIPIYNVEKYVGRCIMSCLNQNVPSDSYEIIVINDGTPDKSAIIAGEIAKQYSNVTLYEQENQGLSVARNNGLILAKGEYVWFVDSDDWIEENILGRIISKLTDNLDLLQLRYRYVYEDGTPSRDSHKNSISEIRSGEEVTLAGGLIAQAQFTIYRRDFLVKNNLQFVRGIYHEDSEFKPRATLLAKKIAFDDEISYNYLQRTSGSITSKFTLKRAQDLLTVMNNLYNFSRNYNTQIRRVLYRKIGMAMNTLLYGYRSLNSDEKHLTREMLKNNKHIFNCMVSSNNKKYIMEGALFRLNIECGLVIHRLLR